MDADHLQSARAGVAERVRGPGVHEISLDI
jgi:hypothetical protein